MIFNALRTYDGSKLALVHALPLDKAISLHDVNNPSPSTPSNEIFKFPIYLSFSNDEPLRVGFIGSYGNRWANIAFGDSDLIIVLGSRLDIRQTGADTKFIENRKIFHVDCEKGEINNRVKGCVAIHSYLKDFFNSFALFTQINKVNYKLPIDWLNYINDLKIKWSDLKELNPIGINPNLLIQKYHLNKIVSNFYRY